MFVFLFLVLCSMNSCVADEDGLRHMLLCRVILGKMEVIPAGSQQYHPSSDDFDSGVDNLSAPNRYIVWSTHMNTHILPEYIVTFRAPPCLKGEPFNSNSFGPFDFCYPKLKSNLDNNFLKVKKHCLKIVCFRKQKSVTCFSCLFFKKEKRNSFQNCFQKY